MQPPPPFLPRVSRYSTRPSTKASALASTAASTPRSAAHFRMAITPGSRPGDPRAQGRSDEGERLRLEPGLLAIWQRAQRRAEEDRESVDGGPGGDFDVGVMGGV